jgi:HEPN domain-containing protein
MRELTKEWVAKAEGDLRVARREVRVKRGANFDAVCFHSQQCVEKYMKALLQEREQTVPRVHDLNQLLEFCLPVEPGLETFRPLLKELTIYAVECQYPGESANQEDARSALKGAEHLRAYLRPRLESTSPTPY